MPAPRFVRPGRADQHALARRDQALRLAGRAVQTMQIARVFVMYSRRSRATAASA